MPDIHSEKCIADQKRWREAVAEYNDKWPNHCLTCHGWGITGNGYDYQTGYTDIDPCDICGDDCPRCGQKTFDWAEGTVTVCSACGFDFDHPEGEPQEPDCLCYLLPENDPLTQPEVVYHHFSKRNPIEHVTVCVREEMDEEQARRFAVESGYESHLKGGWRFRNRLACSCEDEYRDKRKLHHIFFSAGV